MIISAILSLLAIFIGGTIQQRNQYRRNMAELYEIEATHKAELRRMAEESLKRIDAIIKKA